MLSCCILTCVLGLTLGLSAQLLPALSVKDRLLSSQQSWTYILCSYTEGVRG
jgi:hypothetical protein